MEKEEPDAGWADELSSFRLGPWQGIQSQSRLESNSINMPTRMYEYNVCDECCSPLDVGMGMVARKQSCVDSSRFVF